MNKYSAIYFLLIVLFAIVQSSCDDERNSTSKQDEQIDSLSSQTEDDLKNDIRSLVKNSSESARDIWQKPSLIINKFDQISTKIIADIGAGTGYFSLRMLPIASKVIAIDIDENVLIYLDSLKTLFPPELKEKLETRLVVENDPGIKDQEVDGILISNTYTYLEDRHEYLKRMKDLMKPNATLVIVDYKKRHLPVGPPKEMKISISDLEDEIVGAGFIVDEIDDQSLKYQYILKAYKP